MVNSYLHCKCMCNSLFVGMQNGTCICTGELSCCAGTSVIFLALFRPVKVSERKHGSPLARHCQGCLGPFQRTWSAQSRPSIWAGFCRMTFCCFDLHLQGLCTLQCMVAYNSWEVVLGIQYIPWLHAGVLAVLAFITDASLRSCRQPSLSCVSQPCMDQPCCMATFILIPI